MEVTVWRSKGMHLIHKMKQTTKRRGRCVEGNLRQISSLSKDFWVRILGNLKLMISLINITQKLTTITTKMQEPGVKVTVTSITQPWTRSRPSCQLPASMNYLLWSPWVAPVASTITHPCKEINSWMVNKYRWRSKDQCKTFRMRRDSETIRVKKSIC